MNGLFKNTTGAFADSAILFPLMILLSLENGFSAEILFLTAGVAYCTSGLFFRIPMPVQPLKSIAIAAVALGATFNEVRISAVILACYCLLMVLFKGYRLANKIPLYLIHGLQVGLGLLMICKGLEALNIFEQNFLTLIYCGVAFVLILFFSQNQAFPLLGIVALVGLGIGMIGNGASIQNTISADESVLRIGLIVALVLPQIVLTSANSVIGTEYAAKRYFGHQAKRATIKNLLLFIGLGNLVSSAVGGLPFCHGSGGMTAHVKGGANHWISNCVIGVFLIGIALVVSITQINPITHFPTSIIAILLVSVGLLHIQLAKPSWQHPHKLKLIVMGTVALVTQNMLLILAAGILMGLIETRLTLRQSL